MSIPTIHYSSMGNAPTTTATKSFSFTAYSLASAVLMGSSVGLAILQTHQLWFLNGLLTFTSALTTTTGSLTERSTAMAATTATTSVMGTMATAFMSGLSHFVSFMVSAWVPLLVWFLSLLISALWTHRYFARSQSSRGHPLSKRSSTSLPEPIYKRQQIAIEQRRERLFTPRTVILASHVLFSFFWVILAAVQEVEEQRTRISRGGRTKIETTSQGPDHSGHRPPHVAQTPGTSTTTSTTGALMMLSLEEKQALTLANASDGSMIVYPLCIVWLFAIVLLGMATGLMTSSSAVLEDRVLYMNDYDYDDNSDCSTGPEGAISNTAKMQKHDEKEQDELPFTSSNSATTITNPLVDLARFSWAQRACLFLLLQLLFSVLMPFYQWMLSLDRVLPLSLSSSKSSPAVAWLSTSSAMSLFGIFLGTLMIGLGRRLVPTDPKITPFSHVHSRL